MKLLFESIDKRIINRVYESDYKILFSHSTRSLEITVNVVNPEWQWVCRNNSNAFICSFNAILERIFFTNIKVILCKGAFENYLIYVMVKMNPETIKEKNILF